MQDNSTDNAYEFYGDSGLAKNSRYISVSALENRINEQVLCKIEKILRRDNQPSFDGKSTVPVTLYLVLRARKDMDPDLFTRIDGKELRLNNKSREAMESAWGTNMATWKGKLVNLCATIDKAKVILVCTPAPGQASAPGPVTQAVTQRVAPAQSQGFDPQADADLAAPFG